jgi:hypothetical protein
MECKVWDVGFIVVEVAGLCGSNAISLRLCYRGWDLRMLKKKADVQGVERWGGGGEAPQGSGCKQNPPASKCMNGCEVLVERQKSNLRPRACDGHKDL